MNRSFTVIATVAAFVIGFSTTAGAVTKCLDSSAKGQAACDAIGVESLKVFGSPSGAKPSFVQTKGSGMPYPGCSLKKAADGNTVQKGFEVWSCPDSVIK